MCVGCVCLCRPAAAKPAGSLASLRCWALAGAVGRSPVRAVLRVHSTLNYTRPVARSSCIAAVCRTGAPGSAQPRPTGKNGRPIVAATSLPRERMGEFQNEAAKYMAARNGEALAAQLAAQQQQQQQLIMQQQQAAAAANSSGGSMVAGRQQGSIPGNSAAMQQQQQQQLMAAMQQQQQHYAMEQYHQQHQQLTPQEEEEAYRQQQQQQQRKMAGHPQVPVENLGSHVSSMTVMDCHNSSAVPMSYHSYAQQNPIYRSSSYQVQSMHRL